MKVAKFGGTSLASADQIKKVCNIIVKDNDRKLIVVSAPGKRNKDDIKVTDLLISLAEKHLEDGNSEKEFSRVIKRFSDIIHSLGLGGETLSAIMDDLNKKLSLDASDPGKFTDSLKAAGEDNCARLVADYLNKLGKEAHYINPGEAGMILSKEFGNAAVLPESYEKLAKLRDRPGISVFPGFFGYSADGEIVTFSRGGSDITGSILAAATCTDLYENFTDVDSVYAVNPNIVANPVPITVLTYREMRELSYAGFSIFHEEALAPVYHKGIPVAIKNTNNPGAPGTTIVMHKEVNKGPVVGIASDSGFCSINIRKYLMNREVGFGRKLLQILEDENLSYEHTPSGIDDISVILSQGQLDNEKEKRVVKKIRAELEVDEIQIEHDLALVMVVGEGARNAIGMASRAAGAFARAGVNIEMINQGSSEVSIMFGVKSGDAEKSVKCLYDEFFC